MVTSGEDFFQVAAEAADIKCFRREVDAELRCSPEWAEYEGYLSAALKVESTRLEVATGAGNIQAKVARPYERAWTLTGSDQAAHERFKYLARLAVAALGHKSSSPDEAVDGWLERVFEYGEAERLRRDEGDWHLERVAERSAHCAELATYQAANLKSAQTLKKLETQFGQLPQDLHAIRRKDTRPKSAAMVHPEAEQAALAKERQAVVMPILKRLDWSRNKLACDAGISPTGVNEYLDGTRRRLTAKNRKAIADALGIKPEALPN